MMVHMNWTLVVLPLASDTLALTKYGLDVAAPALTVPVIQPVAVLRLRPPGRLVAR